MAKRASVPGGKGVFFPAAEDGANAGRPAARVDASPSRQSAIFLQDRHLDWLDERCREARHNGGRAIRKAEIIRALLDVAMDLPIDFSGLRRNEDLTERVRASLRQQG